MTPGLTHDALNAAPFNPNIRLLNADRRAVPRTCPSAEINYEEPHLNTDHHRTALRTS